ncbi:MAG: phosphoribosyltransferase [Acidimicrobiia bacterium]
MTNRLRAHLASALRGGSRFPDRAAAGRALAGDLAHLAGRPKLVVLGLPRGGLPVAYEVAAALDAPLDVFLVRKLGVPGQEELAMGAIASGGIRVVNHPVVDHLGIAPAEVEAVTRSEAEVLAVREAAYRGDRPPLDLSGATVILVDDGLATGASMRAAAAAVRRQSPAHLVVAVPVAATETCEAMAAVADEVVCSLRPTAFHAVGLWYEDFSQVDDHQVTELLARAWSRG